ncbi:copper resistance CopC/CopD family protein [Paenibacillus wynnii]|uniref:copper resistance CopC/CopD family protein n=1 Tax=Paenibacillus wynnii TaxID=268407 RepID=UPI00278D46DC|nr:copper resistance protein CopC [Paenibacillus wynnii]MDQ0195472.1 putative copper export protein/methionine-rich copper-binding protein CopC [Paenibacillus wynnii]
MKQRIYNIVILLVMALFVLPAPVSAHAKVLQSVPAANAKLQNSPSEIKIQYSEGFNAELSKITLQDAAGKPITGKLTSGTDQWLIYQIPTLSGGAYTVKYQVLSEDTHVTEGSFTFTVAAVKPTATPVASTQPTDAAAGITTTPSPKSTPKVVEPTPTEGTVDEIEPNILIKSSNILNPVLRVVEVLAAIAAAGFIIFRYGIWGILHKEEAPPLFSKRNERALYIVVLVLFILSGILQAGILTDQLSGPGTGSFWILWQKILTDTLVGAASWLRPAAAAVLLLTTLGSRNQGRLAFVVKLSAIFIIILLFPMTGHAYGALSGVTYAVISQVLHIGTAAVWFGGLIGIMAAIQSRKQSGLNYEQLNRLILRFSFIALPSVVVIALSGVFLALLRVGSWNALFHSEYGQIILAKSTIVLLIWIIAAYHRMVLLPRMKNILEVSPTDKDLEIPRRFILSVRAEIIMAVTAFVLAGMLSTTPPPEQALEAAPVYWHVMGESAHMSMRVNFKEDIGQTLQLDVWLPSGMGAPSGVEVQLNHSGEQDVKLAVPFKYKTGGPDPYGYEGFDKYTYRAAGRYFTEKGEWKAVITFTDSKGEAHSYEKVITL